MAWVAGITIDLSDLSEYDRRLARVIGQLTDLRPFWPLVVPLFIAWMGEQFASEGGFFGSRWAPLSPAYAIQKAQRYPGKGILYATGAMRGAASLPSRTATATELRLSVNDRKLNWHQHGTNRMPARPVMPERGLPARALADLERVAADYAREVVTRELGSG